MSEPVLLTADPAPWLVRVEHAEARLRCDWPRACPPRILRGAVIAEMDRLLPHGAGVDWHQHDDRGDSAQRIPRILYRVRGGEPSLWAWGPQAHHHLSEVVRRLHALRLPGGGVVDVAGVDLTSGTTDCQVTGKSWHRYELVTPIFPSYVVYGRRPRHPGPERWAWAGQYVTSAILTWFREAGLDVRGGQQRLHVHLGSMDDGVEVSWERPEQGKRITWRGFRARVVTNAILPDGMGLGRHRAEGFGEVRRCAS